MSTSASIALLYKDGTIESVYCHWDGYPTHTGELLQQFYTTEVEVESLLAHGNISSLGMSIGNRHNFNERVQRHPTWGPEQTTFYGRDRGEVGQLSRRSRDIGSWLQKHGQEYNYLFVDGRWLVSRWDDQEPMTVDEAVARELG